MSKFEREDRYLILKRKDIDKYLDTTDKDVLGFMCHDINEGRLEDNRGELNAVVIETDWPEYETVWKMIQDRVTGQEVNDEH